MKELEDLLKRYIYSPVCDKISKTVHLGNEENVYYAFHYTGTINEKVRAASWELSRHDVGDTYTYNVHIHVAKKIITVGTDFAKSKVRFPKAVASVQLIREWLGKHGILFEDEYNIKDILE